MRHRIAITSFIALVTGCGAPAQRQDPSSIEASPPGPETRGYGPTFQWMGGVRGEEAGLGFAVPETDAVGIDMTCGRGSRSIRVSAVDPNGRGTQLDIGSGATQLSVAATATADSMIDDSTYAVALVPSDASVFEAFKASGELWAWDAADPMTADTDAEREAIAAFFHHCDGAR